MIQSGWRHAKEIAVLTAWSAMPLGIVYLILASIGLAWNPYICLTDTVYTVKDLSGYDILVSDTNCDAIAKWDYTRVYISRAGRDGNRRSLIFEYDPMERNPIPDFSVDPDGNLLITIASVATVFHQEREWGGKKITYNIGKEYYPEPEQSPGGR